MLGVLPIHLWVECSRTGPGLDEILIAAASGKEASSDELSSLVLGLATTGLASLVSQRPTGHSRESGLQVCKAAYDNVL